MLYTPPLLSMGDPFAASTASPAPLSLPNLLEVSTDSSKSRSVFSVRAGSHRIKISVNHIHRYQKFTLIAGCSFNPVVFPIHFGCFLLYVLSSISFWQL